MSVQALIADLLVPVSPPPRASKATSTRGERGEKGENPRPVWSGARANMGESGANRGESRTPSRNDYTITTEPFAPNSPLFAPDSPAFSPPRTRAIAEDSPNSPLSPKVHGTLHSPDTAQSAIEELARLIEGAEALAKIRPATDPAPLATASYGEVVAWMDAAGETDPEVRRDILTGYGFDPDFQYPDSGRRTCRQCRNLDADGGCRAARRGQIPNASRHYTWPAGIDAPHRCVGYLPGPDDLDKRPGRERFDWPTAETQPDTAKAVCARCAHWTPDRINPPGGLGRCTVAAPASKRPGSLWPWLDAEIHCTRFQEITPC